MSFWKKRKRFCDACGDELESWNDILCGECEFFNGEDGDTEDEDSAEPEAVALEASRIPPGGAEYISNPVSRNTEREFCPYCHGITATDMRGNCYACGGQKGAGKPPREKPSFSLFAVTSDMTPHEEHYFYGETNWRV